MFYDHVEVMGIKMAVAGIENVGISSKMVLLRSINYLLENYEIMQEAGFLEKATWHIYAYLELGFPYDSVDKEMSLLLNYLQMDKKDLFPEEKWSCTRVLLNKSSIRELLGKWNPNMHSMKIADAVQDIIGKISRKEVGIYTYHSGKVIKQNDGQTLWENTFKLYVESDEAIFYNVNRNKYYTF